MAQQDFVTNHSFLKVDGRYVCADNLRFACILAIIAVHAVSVLPPGTTEGLAVNLFQMAAVTVAKFGTIGFFLISGFLLEKNLDTRSSLDIMQRRFRKVFLPWSLWFTLTCAALCINDFAHHKHAFLVLTPLHLALWQTVVRTFTTTAFWFVPNLLLSFMVLLTFRRYLQSLVFGAVLLATSLFYSLNVYTQWIDPHHTRAFFGFIFYLWLGHYAARNIDLFNKFLYAIPFGPLGLATLLSVLAAVGEGQLLRHLHSVDPMNTLRFTIQVFSVLVFLCFFKYQRRIWPAFFDVPRTTFGMYLSHVIVLAAFTSPVKMVLRWPGPSPFLGSYPVRLATWLAVSALTAGVSFAIARALSISSSLSWTVGSTGRSARARESKDQAPIKQDADNASMAKLYRKEILHEPDSPAGFISLGETSLPPS